MRDTIIILILIGAIAGFLVTRISGEDGKSAAVYLSDLNYPTQTINIGAATITVSVADTNKTRMQGLSGVAELNNDEGMLFVFEEDGLYSFWMKDMLIPIDIMWITVEGEIVGLFERFDPSSYPRTIASEVPARYVLEVKAGFIDEEKVKLGDQIFFE